MTINERMLKKVIEGLNEFRYQSHVPKNVDDLDPRKTWIISEDEAKALDVVIDTLQDCRDMGNHTMKVLKELEGK